MKMIMLLVIKKLATLSASRYPVLSGFVGCAELRERAFAYQMVIARKRKKVNSGGVISV